MNGDGGWKMRERREKTGCLNVKEHVLSQSGLQAVAPAFLKSESNPTTRSCQLWEAWTASTCSPEEHCKPTSAECFCNSQ